MSPRCDSESSWVEDVIRCSQHYEEKLTGCEAALHAAGYFQALSDRCNHKGMHRRPDRHRRDHSKKPST